MLNVYVQFSHVELQIFSGEIHTEYIFAVFWNPEEVQGYSDLSDVVNVHESKSTATDFVNGLHLLGMPL